MVDTTRSPTCPKVRLKRLKKHESKITLRNPLADHVDIIQHVVSFAGGEGYLFVAGVARAWKTAWPEDVPKETNLAVAVQTSRLLAWARVADCPWNETTCSIAAAGGYLGAIKYARTGLMQKCSQEPASVPNSSFKPLEGGKEFTPPQEIDEGRKILEFVPCLWDDETCANAAQGGHFKLLKWCRSNGCPWDECTCACAAEGGYLGILKWCRANGCPWDEWTCTFAAQRGRITLLKWSRLHDCPCNPEACAAIARRGDLETLRWCRANGCPWDEWTCASAARGGHLQLLKWCRANGCPWDHRTLRAATRGGPDNQILKWCRENGCPTNM